MLAGEILPLEEESVRSSGRVRRRGFLSTRNIESQSGLQEKAGLATVKRVIRQRLSFLRRSPWLRECLLFIRGVCFLGARFECPCCGWRVRGFLGRSGWSLQNTDGYCPRCNAKARHRRLWLYLRDHTDFFNTAKRVLDVGSAPGMARALARRDDLFYVSVGIDTGTPYQSVVGDIRALPFEEHSFDVVLCQHVLEHVDDDRRSLAQIRRVTGNGGWLVLSVPIRLNQVTQEDPSVTDPVERTRLFGEPGHVRMYGHDLVDRLADAGFEASLQDACDIPAADCDRYGVRQDEHLFVCRPRQPRAGKPMESHHFPLSPTT